MATETRNTSSGLTRYAVSGCRKSEAGTWITYASHLSYAAAIEERCKRLEAQIEKVIYEFVPSGRAPECRAAVRAALSEKGETSNGN